MRTPLFAANWKMNKTAAEADAFVDALLGALPSLPTDRELLIAPPFTLLAGLSRRLAETKILLAGQNMFHEEHGAYTGEISAGQLTDAGCSRVIIGHSERRALFGETDAVVSKKLQAADRAGLAAIFCLGESLAQRQAGEQKAVVLAQLEAGLQGLSPDFIGQLVVAYEPVWAIGTGENATPAQAQEMHAFLREKLPETARILYGGSVKPANAQALMDQPDVDGFLVGGASLKASDFLKIFQVSL